MTVNSHHKAIIVADEGIHEFFTAELPEWDTQTPVRSINELWEGLENGSLDQQSDVILFHDEIYDVTPQDLIEAMGMFAPIAFVGLIAYNENDAPTIIEKALFFAEHSPDVEYTAGTTVYPISVENPIGSLDDALYVHSTGEEPQNTGEINPDNNVNVDPHVISGIEGSVGMVDVSHDGIVVASTSSKGGSGKSTVALMLGGQLALSSQKAYEAGLTEAPLKVCILDMDIRDGQIGFIIHKVSPTVLQVRTAPNPGPEAIEQNLVYAENLGVHALLAPKSGRSAHDLTPEFYTVLINNLRHMFDVVILDTSVNYLDRLLYQVCYPTSDAILFVTTLAKQSVFGMTRWFNELSDSGGESLDTNKVGIVVNQSVPNVGVDKSKLESAAPGARIAAAIPLETAAFVAASNRNDLRAMLYHPTIGPAYFSLAKKIAKDAPLLPLVEDFDANSTSTMNKSAPRPVQQDNPNGSGKKSGGLFRRK